MAEDYRRPDPDLGKGHPLLQERVPVLENLLRHRYGWEVRRLEVYRPELRQQWLYGAGRTVGEIAPRGISPMFARPREPRVTNAWSARVSAHGFAIGDQPASCAIDLCPLGQDRRPFTKDDPWDEFVRAMVVEGLSIGLVHFHAPGKAVWDKPHLELLEWSNRARTLVERKDPGD